MKTIIPAAALDQHIAILAKTGKGKTYAAKGIVEGLLDQRRQVGVLDPTGAWWGLRLGADGKGKGYDVVLIGGEHADIPLSPMSGAAVARLLTQQGASVVIDTSGLTVGEYTRWFIDFAGTLYTTVRNPLHLVIDEAHQFMPQGRVHDVEGGKMLHAGNRLMSGGRSKGIRGMLITQRPAKLHKDSLTCADTLIAMGMIAPQDRQAVKDWIDGAGDPAHGKTVIDSLAQLKRGEGWVWYPEGGFLERVTFPRISTYDSSATPKHGQAPVVSVKQINLDEVKAAMADAVKEAEANDPKALRAKIAMLEKAGGGEAVLVQRLKEQLDAIRAERDGLAHRLNHTIETVETMSGRLDAIRKVVLTNTGDIVLPPMGKVHSSLVYNHPTMGKVKLVADRDTPPGEVRAVTFRDVKPTSDLPVGEAAVLRALIQYPNGLKRGQIGVITGYPKRSTRDAYIARLAGRGYVYPSGDRIIASAEGVKAMPDAEPLPTGAALQEYWLARLPEGEAAVLRCVLERYPREVPREEISEATGYDKRSTRDAYIARLATKELVTGRSAIKASESLV